MTPLFNSPASQTVLHIQLSQLRAGLRTLVADLDWQVREGEVWSVVGTNGCGKSTLLKLIAGLSLPAGFQAAIHANSVAAFSQADRLAWMPQSDALPFDCLVRERVLSGRYGKGRFWAWDTAEDERLLAEVLTAMDLAGMQNRLLSSLSGGERRRVSLAGALMQNAQLTLLDEPMGQLDWAHQVQLGKLIRGWPGLNQKALVWVTHDPNMALRFSTHMLALGPEGRVWQGSVCDMAKPEVFEQVYGCCIEASGDPFLFFPKI